MGSTDVKFKVLCHQTVKTFDSMNDFEVFRLPIKSISLVQNGQLSLFEPCSLGTLKYSLRPENLLFIHFHSLTIRPKQQCIFAIASQEARLRDSSVLWANIVRVDSALINRRPSMRHYHIDVKQLLLMFSFIKTFRPCDGLVMS